MLKSTNFLIISYLFTRILALVVFNSEIRSLDHLFWVRVITVWQQGGNPYAETNHLNWPPFWPFTLVILDYIANLTKLNLVFLIRFFLVLTEASLLFISYRFLVKNYSKDSVQELILIYILCPIPLILVTVHCNFDVLVGLFVFLGLSSLASYQELAKPSDWLRGCAYLGLGILTKTIPLILAPLLLCNIKKLKLKILIFGVALLLFPTLLSISYLYYLSPQTTIDHVIAYRSYPGFYGVTGLLYLFGEKEFVLVYQKIFFVFLLLVSIGASFYFIRVRTIALPRIFLFSAIILLMIPNLGSGYGPQYAFWSLPLIAVIMAFASRDLRLVIYCWLVVISITYLVEYSISDTHGSLLGYFTNWNITEISQKWSSRTGQTLLRLPQFGASLVLLYFLTSDLFQKQSKTIV